MGSVGVAGWKGAESRLLGARDPTSPSHTQGAGSERALVLGKTHTREQIKLHVSLVSQLYNTEATSAQRSLQGSYFMVTTIHNVSAFMEFYYNFTREALFTVFGKILRQF